MHGVSSQRPTLHTGTCSLSNVHASTLFPYERRLYNRQLFLHHIRCKTLRGIRRTFHSRAAVIVGVAARQRGKEPRALPLICIYILRNLQKYASSHLRFPHFADSKMRKATAAHLMLPAPLLTPFLSVRLLRQRRN